MATISQPELDAITAKIQANPAIAQALVANQQKQTLGRSGANPTDPRFKQTQADVLKQYGIDLPADYYVGINKNDPSNVTVQQQSWFARNADWLVPLAVIGGGAGFAALTGGAGVAATGATPGVTGGTTAGTVAGTTAATTAAAKAPSLWSRIAAQAIPAAVTAATQLASTKLQTDAQKQASDKQIAADQAALQWQKDVFQQRQKQLSPFVGAGTAASDQEAYLLGLTPGQSPFPTPPPPSTTGTPLAAPNPSTGPVRVNPPATPPTGTESTSFTNMAPARTVKLRAPDGTERMVDATAAPYYVQRGALVVG